MYVQFTSCVYWVLNGWSQSETQCSNVWILSNDFNPCKVFLNKHFVNSIFYVGVVLLFMIVDKHFRVTVIF